MEANDGSSPGPNPSSCGSADLNPSDVGNLLMAAGDLFGRQDATAPRGWEPLALKAVQAALPQYEITGFVSRGGMGAVYRGAQRALRRDVAVKILPPEMRHGGEDMQFVERFKQEAQAMARLSHPNIVAVFDAGETDGGLLYFVMEYVEGTDLAQLLAAEGALSVRRAVEIARSVCTALAFAHEEGIVHRDIKPSNIMIDRRGRVKVADFGLAKALETENTVMTRSDVALGSPDFAAPELRMPGTKLDGRADLYALGVVLYQMLTGTIPRGRFDPPSGVISQVDKRLDDIVDKAMQADRDKRYACALDMKKDLDAVAADFGERPDILPPASSPSVAAIPRAAMGGKSRRWPLAVGTGVVALLLGIGGFGLLRQADRHLPARSEPAGDHTISDPIAGADGRMQFPPGVWTRMYGDEKLAREFAANPRHRRDGPWMILDQVGLGWYPHEVVPMMNLGFRARFRGKRVDDRMYPQMNLRSVLEKQLPVNLHIHGGKMQIRSTTKGYPILAEATLREPLSAGREYTMEFYAIGRHLIARVNGQVLTAQADIPPLPGNATMFGANMDWFRDVEVLNLDGKTESEARQAAGLE